MKVLFWGTPEFALPALRAIESEGHVLVGVVTQPDRPAGRGRSLKPSPVKQWAEAEGYPVLQPERPRGEAFLTALHELKPDISVVAAYGHILVEEVLEAPPHGSINVHASLLPVLRGAAPVAWAVAHGHDVTGVTIMRMVRAMDAGPILLQAEEPIAAQESASALSARLSELGAELLVEALALLEVDALEEREQDHTRATFAPKLTRELARIDFAESSTTIERLVRAMDAVPGAWCRLGDAPLKLFRPFADRSAATAPPGTVLAADPAAGFRVATGEGSVRFEEVQPAGKRRMPAADWLRGQSTLLGMRLE